MDEAIQSVLMQTYTNWELIIIDDGSKDNSRECVRTFAADSRIHLIAHETNRGVAKARNTGLKLASGRFIAFLDSDDCWLPNKLQTQISEMAYRKLSACFCSYETISHNGEHINFVKVPDSLDYGSFLKNTVTCSHTMVVDCSKVDRNLLFDLGDDDGRDYPEDLAMWLRLLRKDGGCSKAYGLNTVLAKYRKRSGSRSAFKLKAIRRTWNQYVYKEELPLPYASYCLAWQVLRAIRKRVRDGTIGNVSSGVAI